MERVAKQKKKFTSTTNDTVTKEGWFMTRTPSQ